MGTIFVAYGDPEYREQVLEFAAERAGASGDDLLVYHVQESVDESASAVREEVEAVIDRVAPDVAVSVEINAKEASDATNVSTAKRLTDAILETDREFEYVVMGDIERSSVEEFMLPSMTEAVLDTHAVPVLFVPA